MKYNTRLSAQVGLQDDYSVFNLDADTAYENIGIEIITDGGTYVEDDPYTVMHAGNNNFKEFDGINSISSNLWDLTQFGTIAKDTLIKYLKQYKTELNSSNGKELYEESDSYKNYKNLFDVKWQDVPNSVTYTGQYINYKLEAINIEGKSSIIKSLNDLKGDAPNHFVYLNAAVIHYSKYYNLYTTSNISVPVLQPVLYTKEDLDKFNMFTNNGIAYIGTISMFTAWNDDNGSNRDYRREYGYNASQNNGVFNINHDNDRDFSHTADVNWNYSQFKLHSSGKHFITDLSEVSEEYYNDFYPKGFMIFGFKDEKLSLGVNLNNARSTEHYDKQIPFSWRQYFKTGDSTYRLSSHNKIDDDSNNTTPLCALMYRGDKEDNVHLLNCWFGLKASGSGDNRKVTQEISYLKNIPVKKPTYIGMCVASVFCNIYHYVQDSNEPITKITDIVYLSQHYCTFTKDIIYRIYLNLNEGLTANDLIAFRGLKFRSYVEAVKLAAHITSGTTDYKSSENNITINLQSSIKNVPLQYRVLYKEPNIDLINASNNIVLLRTVDKEPKRFYSNGKLLQDRLYLIKYENGLETPEIIFLNENFKIKYLKTINCDYEGTQLISGEFDPDIPEEPNSYLGKTWGVSDSVILSRYKYEQPASDYYSIVTNYSDYDIQFADYCKNEVLLPFAKFVL